MPLQKDLSGIGTTAEESLRIGDAIQYYSTSSGTAQSTATLIGGPTGSTILELNVSTGGGFTFQPTTEQDRTYTIYAAGNTAQIYTPLSAGSSLVSQFQSAGNSLTLTSNKTVWITRIGPIPNPTGSVAADRWIYTLSA